MAMPPLHHLRLQHVRCLLATAQHGNMKAAAEALSITQPAVTKVIKELEALVGQTLLLRQRHGVVLTPAGERFVQHARHSVAALEQALGSVQAADGAPLSLGVLPSLAVSWVDEVLDQWRERGGHGSVRVVTGRNAELLSQLQRGELELVLGRLAEPDRMLDLRFEPLWSEPLVVAMAPQHPLAHAPWSAWRNLACPVVRPLSGTGIRQASDAFLAHINATVGPDSLETLAVSLARNTTLQRGALWFTPLSTVAQDLAEGLLHARGLPGTANEAVGLFVQAGELNAPVQTMVDVVREVAQAWRVRCQTQWHRLTAS